MVEAQVHTVIDNGTGYMKAGFSGEEAPKAVFPTLIGKPHLGALLGSIKKDRLIGQEALEKLVIQEINHPISKGEIKDWVDMENIWHHTFYNELRIQPEDHVVLLTDHPLTKSEQRIKMTEMMFEKFSIPGLFIISHSVLSMFSTGKTSGLVVDSGEELTYCVPIYEGYSFDTSIEKEELGGADLTRYLISLLIQNRYAIDTLAKQVIVNDIKEKMCYVSENYDSEVKESANIKQISKYRLPDGEEFILDYEKFRCPEALFKPNLLENKENVVGIHTLCNNAIKKSDLEIKKDLMANIVLCGGNTMFKGFCERMNTELKVNSTGNTINKIQVVGFPERKYACWIGGSILSSLSNFQYMWITKQDYNEVGPEIVHKKCF